RRAILWVGCLMISVSPTRMLPRRRSTSPRIDFSVVVRPAPLRPSRVTTSPWFTVRSMPCRTWDSPYQALRLSMRSSVFAPPSAPIASDMGGSHIGGHHGFVVGYVFVRAFGQHFALVEDRDGVGEFGD